MTDPGENLPPRPVPFDAAPDAILAHARSIAARAIPAGSAASPVVVVAVTGPVGAGKTTLASRLGGVQVSTDWYLPDYDRVPEHRRDDPEESDLARLLADLLTLKRRETAIAPVWSFHEHRRTGTRPVPPGDLIVLEGIHAHHETHAAAVDLRVYIDAPAEVRWSRWETLEATGQRGMGVAAARAFFEAVAEPSFARRAAMLRSAADIVVLNP